MGIKGTALSCALGALALAGSADALTVTAGGATMTYEIVGTDMVVSSVAPVQGYWGVTFDQLSHAAGGAGGFHCDGTSAVQSTAQAGNHVMGAALQPAAPGGQANCAQGFKVPLALIGQNTNWKGATGTGTSAAGGYHAGSRGAFTVQLAAGGGGGGDAGTTPPGDGTTTPPGDGTTTPPVNGATNAPVGGTAGAAGGGGIIGGLGIEAVAGIGAGGVVALFAGYTLYSRSRRSSGPPSPGPKPMSPSPMSGGMGGGMGGMPAPGPAGGTPWRSTQDPNTGRTYYFNKMTGETSWTPPPGMGGL